MKPLHCLAGSILAILVTVGCAHPWGISWPHLKDQWTDLVPSLSVSPSSLVFGNVSSAHRRNATLTIANSGNDTAEDVTRYVSGTGFRLYSSVTFGNISASKSKVMKVAFEPATAGSYTGFGCYSAPNIARVCASLSGTGTASSAYTTLFSSFWDGSGATDTGGTGVGLPWTSLTDANSHSSVSAGTYVVSAVANGQTSFLARTGLTAKSDVSLSVRATASTTTGYGANAQFNVMETSEAVVRVMANASGVLDRVKLNYRNGSGSYVDSTVANVAFNSSPHTYELRLKYSSAVGTSDGYYQLLIDGVDVIAQTPTTTYSRTGTIARVGISYMSQAMNSAAITFDNLIYGWE